MRRGRSLHRRLAVLILGVVIGGAAGVASVSLGAAAAQQSGAEQRAVFDATHLPPLLTMPDERAELTYEVHCAAGADEGAEAGCEARGAVFVRGAGRGSFQRIALTNRKSDDGVRQLAARIPDSISSQPGGFEYYAELEASDLGQRVTVPAGGADAPHASRSLENPVLIALGRHSFGNARRSGVRLALAAWGDGPDEVGLERGRQLGAIGPSAFDVDAAGTVSVLDQAHRRLLRWHKGTREPVRVPLSIFGTIADLAVGNDGSTYVLESTAEPGRNALVRRFDDAGRELEAIETAERTSSQIRMARDGAHVLGHPSHHWMPMTVGGVPASREAQLRRGRAGRALRTGGELVLFRHANEIRVAVISGRSMTRSWRLTSATQLAEVQRAESIGERLVLVVRMYEDDVDEFAVLTLDRNGLVDRFTLDAADWAETAPLSRFRLVGEHLYRLGSTPAGSFVDRFDLEVR
jgi:hypothetical protein